MTLSDFEFGGYVTLSTFLRIEVLEHAEALDETGVLHLKDVEGHDTIISH